VRLIGGPRSAADAEKDQNQEKSSLLLRRPRQAIANDERSSRFALTAAASKPNDPAITPTMKDNA
jgi:hypothetical protein